MSPLYLDGDCVAVDCAFYGKKNPVVGDIVLCRHPFIKDYLMIKQIELIDEQGKFFVVGINKRASTDSRSFGAIAGSHIIGKVVGKK